MEMEPDRRVRDRVPAGDRENAATERTDLPMQEKLEEPLLQALTVVKDWVKAEEVEEDRAASQIKNNVKQYIMGLLESSSLRFW